MGSREANYWGFEVTCPLHSANESFLSLIVGRRDYELLAVGLGFRRPCSFDKSALFLRGSTLCHVLERHCWKDGTVCVGVAQRKDDVINAHVREF